MKSVGIRELKNQLSKYLGLVKNGEVVVVTDHNKIVAEIRQPAKIELEHDQAKQEIEAYLSQLKKEGKLNRASRSISMIDSFKPTKRPPVKYKWEDIYAKLREDRF